MIAFLLLGLPVTAAAAGEGITGRVTSDSVGLSGATVQAVLAGVVVADDTTNATGQYSLDLTGPGAGPGTYDVRVLAPPASGLAGTSVVGVPVTGPTPVDVALRSPLGSLDVTVTDGTSGAFGASVSLLDGTGTAVASAQTDFSGTARLVTEPGGYALRVSAPPAPPASSPLPAAFVLTTDTPVDVPVGGNDLVVTIPVASIDVQATRAAGGAPIAGAEVDARADVAGLDVGSGLRASGSFGSGVSRTDGTGFAALAALASPGVTVTADGIAADPALADVSILADASSGRADVALAVPLGPAEQVTLTVLDASGVPVPGALVRSDLADATTDSSGQAVFLARSDVPTDVLVNLRDVDPTGLDLPRFLAFRLLGFTPSGPTTLGPLQAPATTPTTIRTLDADTADPVPDASISASIRAFSSYGGRSWRVDTGDAGSTNASGEGSLRLPAFAGRVEASAPGYLPSATTYAASTTSIDVEMTSQSAPPDGPSVPPRTPVTGRVVTPDGVPVPGVTVRPNVSYGTSDTTDADGFFSARAPDGSLPLRLIADNLPNAQELGVPPTFNLRLGSAVSQTSSGVDLGDVVLPIETLDVRVVNSFGDGLANAFVTTESVGTATSTQVGGSTVTASGTTEYPAGIAGVFTSGPDEPGVEPGRARLSLIPGGHVVTVDETVIDLGGYTLPVEVATQVEAGSPNTLQITLAASVTPPTATLSGAPLVSAEPLTLQGPRAVVTSDVTIPAEFAGGGSGVQALLDRWECNEGPLSGSIVDDPSLCGDVDNGARRLQLDDFLLNWLLPIGSGCPAFTTCTDTYPATFTIDYRATASNADFSSFIEGGWQRTQVTVLAPDDEPPTLAIDEDFVQGTEGSLIGLTAAGSDPEGPVEVFWDLDADGTYDSTGTTSLLALPDGQDFGRVAVAVADEAGQVATGRIEWLSTNVAPTGTLQINGPDSSDQVTIDVVDLFDPSPDDLAVLSVDLDLDGEPTGALDYETPGPSATIDAAPLAPGTYPVAARIADDDGGVTELSGAFVVPEPGQNRPPVPDAGGPYRVDEGASITLSGSASDPDGDAVEVTWDVQGLGTGLTDPVAFDAGDGPDTVPVSFEACDDGTPVQCTADTSSITVDNVPPTGTLAVSGAGDTGQLSLEMTDLFDPSAADLAAGLTVQFDITDDGTVDATGPSAVVDISALAAGDYTARAIVSDKDGGRTEYTAEFQVADVPNDPPTVDPGGPYAVDEGGSLTLEASGSDPDGDVVTVTWQIPGQGTDLANPASLDASGLDGPDSVTVVASACDDRGGCATAPATVTVLNVAPTGTLDVDGPDDAGQVTIQVTNLDDPSPADRAALTVEIDTTGDGVPDTSGPFATVDTGGLPPGPVTVTAVVSDDDGASATLTDRYVVPQPPPNRAPVPDPGGPYEVVEGATVGLSATADDPDGDTVSLTWEIEGQGVGLPNPATLDATLVDGPATVAATVTACDEQPLCSTAGTAVAVRNAPPTVSVEDVDGKVGEPAVLELAVDDPAPGDVIDIIVDWGDGTTTQQRDVRGDVTATHTYMTAGEFRVSVAATDDDGDSTTASATADISPLTVDLGIGLTADDGVPEAGDRLEYRLEVTNASAAETSASDVAVRLSLDPGLSYASGSGADWSCSALTSTDVTCALASSLAPGDVASLAVTTEVTDSATSTVATEASVSSAEPDAAPSDNTATADADIAVLDVTAVGVTVDNVAYLDYEVVPRNTTGTQLTVTWIGDDGEVVRVDSDLELAGRLLWPGMAVDGQTPVDWPAFTLIDGRWVVDPNDLGASTVPTAVLQFSLNPSRTVSVDYPGARPPSVPAPAPAPTPSLEPSPTTEPGPATGSDPQPPTAAPPLAVTGVPLASLAVAGGVLLAVGVALVRVARGRSAGAG